MRPLLLLMAALSVAAQDPPSSPDPVAEATLHHRAHEKWDFVLPAEQWRKVGLEIRLPGELVFAAETDGPTTLVVDTNADGRVDKKVRGQDGLLTLRATDAAGNFVAYTVRFKNSGNANWSWATGSSRTGTLLGTTIHVFDQNGNGRYDDFGVDALALGASRSATLLSEVIHLNGELRTLSIDEAGTRVTSAPFRGETGTLQVLPGFESKGTLTAAIFRSGKRAFDLSQAKQGLPVPTGSYEFVSGRVEKGSASASMRKGQMRPLLVTAGQQTSLTWGADLKGEFNLTQNAPNLTIQPNFHLYGTAGEEYYDLLPRGKGPTILIHESPRPRLLQTGNFPAG